MNKKEYSDLIDVWVELQLALGVFSLSEDHFPKGKEYVLKSSLEKAYIKINKMLENNGYRKT